MHHAAALAGAVPGVALADARFIDLVTFRRTGEPVGTPVLFVLDDDRLLVRTAHDAGKLKRLAHTAAVEVTPSDSRGRHLGSTLSGTARVLGPDGSGRPSTGCTPSTGSPGRCSAPSAARAASAT